MKNVIMFTALSMFIGCTAAVSSGKDHDTVTFTEEKNTRSFVVQIDSEIPVSRLAIVMETFRQWQTVLGDSAQFKVTIQSITDDQDIGVIKIAHRHVPGTGGGYCWAVMNNGITQSAIIHLDKHIDSFTYRWVTLHEFGHAFGLDHNISNNSVMYEVPNLDDIQCIDKQNLCKIWECTYSC